LHLSSRSVTHETDAFSKRFGVDDEEAYIAGVFHGIARDLPHELIISLCGIYGHYTSEIELKELKLLLSYALSAIVKTNTITISRDVLPAIESYTMRVAKMSIRAYLLFTFDFADP